MMMTACQLMANHDLVAHPGVFSMFLFLLLTAYSLCPTPCLPFHPLLYSSSQSPHGACRQAMVFKKKQSAVDEQIAEIDKLNAVINAAERDMLKLRKVWVVFI